LGSLYCPNRRSLAEGNSIRAAARIVQVDKDAVCEWLDRAAQHCRLVMLSLWRNLHVIECQWTEARYTLDELWSFVHTKEGNLPFAKLYDETYGDAWVWVAFAPIWCLVLAFVIRAADGGKAGSRWANTGSAGRMRCLAGVKGGGQAWQRQP